MFAQVFVLIGKKNDFVFSLPETNGEKINEAKNKLQSQVGEKKVIVLITGDIFSAVLHRICCDALDSTQVSSHAIYISNYIIPKDVYNRFTPDR